MSAVGGESSGNLSGPIKRKRRRRSLSLKPARNFERVDEFMSDIRDDETGTMPWMRQKGDRS